MPSDPGAAPSVEAASAAPHKRSCTRKACGIHVMAAIGPVTGSAARVIGLGDLANGLEIGLKDPLAFVWF